MTSIIGIRTNEGLEGVVLASDHQLSYEDDNGKVTSKRPIRKIYTGSCWAMGDAGRDDKDVRIFYAQLRRNEESPAKIERAIKDKQFIDVNALNTRIMKNGASYDETHAFLLARNGTSVELWSVDEFGNLHETPEENDFDYVALGSGKKEIQDYIERIITEGVIDRDKITLPVAIKTAYKAVCAVEKDTHTGLGYDLVVITKDNIKDWGPDIKRAVAAAERSKLDEIEKSYFSAVQSS